MLTRVLLAVVVIAFGLVAPGQAQDADGLPWDNGIGHSSWALALETEDRKRVLALWDAIGDDLKIEQNNLAGTFVKGGYNSGYFLRWSVKKGFLVIPYFDQNLITDFGYGKVTIVNDSEVIFTSERELKGGRGLGKMPQRWTAIWGYFAPVESLRDFAQYRAGLGQYNEFLGNCCEFAPVFLCARIDRKDLPFPTEVPVRFRSLVRDPIWGEVVSVGKRKIREWGYQGRLYGQWMEKTVLIPARINVGKSQGVKRNMLFRMIGEPAWADRYFQVMRVGRDVSHGYVVHEFFDDGKENLYRDYSTDQDKPLPPIRVGIKVTTSPVIDKGEVN